VDRILILSFQQSSGKSTLALQLVNAYRQRGWGTILMDYCADQQALEWLEEGKWQQGGGVTTPAVRGVSAVLGGDMLSRVWAEEVSDSDMVVIDTSLRLEQARLDYLLRQVSSVLLPVDVSALDLEQFEQYFSELIKRIRMVKSRLVVVATHCAEQGLLKVVQLRQELDQFQIPLVMKLEQVASESQADALAQMLLSEDMRVDSVSGNRLGRALRPAMARAASMVDAVDALSGIVDEVTGGVLEEGRIEREEPPSPLQPQKERNQRLSMENERLRRS
jgi:cellulose biosynthesis protein BcsQ